jgi:hypothetical protein
MTRLLIIIITFTLIQACSGKKDLPAPGDGFPSTNIALPAELTGKWVRVSSLRTFDYKPDEWVLETSNPTNQKYLQLNADKTYSSNEINCSNCRIELFHDTLYVRHNEGFYKFPVLLLNDSSLHLKTKIEEPAYSLPNTGLFDFVLEKKYRKEK